MPQKIYFNGAGLITALGNSVQETLSSIEQGGQAPSQVTIKQVAGDLTLPYHLIKHSSANEHSERTHQLLTQVIEEALRNAGLESSQLQHMGLFLGSTSFDMCDAETAIKQTDRSAKQIAENIPPFNALTHYIQETYAIQGPVFTFNTACTSSANALMYAAEFIRRGDITHALIMGIEFFNELTALGFSSLGLISHKGMNPFSAERDGLILGESSSALIVSSDPTHAKFAYLGSANIADNFSITASNPDGNVVQKVIEQALKKTNVDKQDITLIKTHGTASLSNDESESAGIIQAFEDSVPPITALKPFIGHTLGACGVAELIIFYRSLQQRKLLTFPCRFAEASLLRTANADDLSSQGHYLLNYFGFGGNCTTLVVADV